MPAISAKVVIRIGRRRTRPACISASSRSTPCASSLRARSSSRIAFFATRPISMMMPMKLIRLSVPRGEQQRQHHADQRQRQRQHHRQRRRERAELHHQHQVHERDAHDERGAHLAEHFLLVARRRRPARCRSRAGSRSPSRASARRRSLRPTSGPARSRTPRPCACRSGAGSATGPCPS